MATELTASRTLPEPSVTFSLHVKSYVVILLTISLNGVSIGKKECDGSSLCIYYALYKFRALRWYGSEGVNLEEFFYLCIISET